MNNRGAAFAFDEENMTMINSTGMSHTVIHNFNSYDTDEMLIMNRKMLWKDFTKTLAEYLIKIK